MAARTRNTYLQAVRGFCKWCVQTERVASNPLARITKADEKSDRRRQRRSMTEPELVKLLQVARLRPLAEYGRTTTRPDENETEVNGKPPKRSNWTKAVLSLDTMEAVVERARERLANNPEFVEKLERLGRERALIYKTLVLTGLRRNELASLTVGQLELDGPMPFVVLNAADEKNRQGSTIPLRRDLANDLGNCCLTRRSRLRYAYAAKRVFVTASDRCSLFPPDSFASSTATCWRLASPRPTSGDEPSTFTPCETHWERC